MSSTNGRFPECCTTDKCVATRSLQGILSLPPQAIILAAFSVSSHGLLYRHHHLVPQFSVPYHDNFIAPLSTHAFQSSDSKGLKRMREIGHGNAVSFVEYSNGMTKMSYDPINFVTFRGLRGRMRDR